MFDKTEEKINLKSTGKSTGINELDKSRHSKEVLNELLIASQSLAVFREIANMSPIESAINLLKGILDENSDSKDSIRQYYGLVNIFLSQSSDYNQSSNCNQSSDYNRKAWSWKALVLDIVLHRENSFSRLAENENENGNIPPLMKKAVDHDLDCILKIANMPWSAIEDLLEEKLGAGPVLKVFTGEDEFKWSDLCRSRGLLGWDVDSLIEYYRQKGSGLFSLYKGFYWDGKNLLGIENTDPITLDQLLEYDIQKEILIDNTERYLSGYPANNVLLYGDKGTGKSSMVKALINKYWDKGLRIIELPKIHLDDYYSILRQTQDRAFKFILFIDDLSFEEHEVEYKHIKALLEGGLRAKPTNLLVYATSNRRHLVKELVSDRSSTGYKYNDRNEISPTDSMQEKLSLSDRFGITLTFIAPNQKSYLKIVESMAKRRNIDMDKDILFQKALRWEKRYNGPSGRTARQFIDHLEGGGDDL